MITKREWAKQIVTELEFLSDISKLKNSWIEGTGPYSAGYSEEMCVLFDDLNLEEVFIPEAKSLNLSEIVIDALKAVCRALNDFDTDDMSESQILESADWTKCMKIISDAAQLLNGEIEKIPEIPIVQKP